MYAKRSKKLQKSPVIWLLVIGLGWTLDAHSISEQKYTPPDTHEYLQYVTESYDNDRNRDRIDDDLYEKVARTAAMDLPYDPRSKHIESGTGQDEILHVELIFRKQVTQAQIDAFEAAGGKINYIYKAVSYGWNGRLPIWKIKEIPALMGPDLLIIDEAGRAEIH